MIDVAAMKKALVRIQTEYVEMPGLKLTLPQAGRLFGLPVHVCNDALTILLAGGFLLQMADGSFIYQGAHPLGVDSLDLAGRAMRGATAAAGA
jgi:hypothetical protein